MAVQNNTALIHFQGYYKPSFIFWSFLHATQSQTSCITMNSFQDTTSHILLSHSLMFTLHFIFYSSLFTTQCSYFSMYVLFNYFIHFCFTAIYLKHVSLIFPLYMLLPLHLPLLQPWATFPYTHPIDLFSNKDHTPSPT